MNPIPPLLAVVAMLLTPAQSAETAEKTKIWTPEEIVTEGTKLCDNSTRRVVEFRVGSIRQVPTVAADGKKRDVPHLVPAGGFPRFGGFSVPLEFGYIAALAIDSITDLESHFVGKKITISGIVRASALDVFGRETIWSYYVTLRSPGQIRVIESLNQEHRPTVQRSSLEQILNLFPCQIVTERFFPAQSSLNESALLLLKGENLLFNRSPRNQFVTGDDSRLANAMSSISRLIFDGRIPPRIKMHNRIRPRKSKPDATRFETYEKDRDVRILLELLHRGTSISGPSIEITIWNIIRFEP